MVPIRVAETVFYTKDSISKRFGLAPSTIDDYVARGLLQPIKSGDGIAFLSTALVTIEIIQKGKSLGFSLWEIKRLVDAHSGVSPFANDGNGGKA